MFFIEQSYFNTDLRPETELIVGNKDYSVMCLFVCSRQHAATGSSKMLIGCKIEARILTKENFFLSTEKQQQKVTMIGDFSEEVIRK